MNTNDDDSRNRRRSSWTGLQRIEAEFLRSRRALLVLAVASLILQAALSLPVPVLQGRVIDQVASSFRHGIVRDGAPRSSPAGWARQDGLSVTISLMLAAMIGCHVARMLLGGKVATTMSRITLEVVRDLTETLHRKLQRLEMSYFDREPTGHVMARLTSDVGSLLLFLNGGSLQLLSDLVLAAGICGFLFWLQWRLALVGMLAMPLFLVNHRWFSGSLYELNRALRDQVSALYALLSERVPAVRVVRAFVKEEAELAELDGRLDKQRSLGWSCPKIVARQGAWCTLINGLGIAGVLACGAVLVEEGRLTVGELLAFSALLSQLYQPIVRLTGAQAMLGATMVAVDRIVEILDEPETRRNDEPEAPRNDEHEAPRNDEPEARISFPEPRRIRRPRGRLDFRDVSFSYPRGGRRVLEQITLEIEPGMTLGVMGTSGSGKSTLLALAPRIYEIPRGHGTISLDSHDIRRLDHQDLRRAVALVPQQAMLFEGTIRSNLTYAAIDPCAMDIGLALEMTGLDRWVASLPDGVDTRVGERGQTLSGGQRQRLALARALLADPAILLLDDCTSALDSETEARIHASLAEHWLERTCIVVSHKVASVRDADRIVVLDAGRIVEDGTHATLVRQGGYYSRTYAQQTSALVGLDDFLTGRTCADHEIVA